MLVNKLVLRALKNALKLGMVAENPEAIPIIESVQPVIQVDEYRLVGVVKSLYGTLNLDVAPIGALVASYTCPTGKRAYLLSAVMDASTNASMIILGTEGSATDWGALTLRNNVEKHTFPQGSIWVDAGKSLGAYATDNIGDTAIAFGYLVVEVDW